MKNNKSKSRPIIFNSEMVNAILDGRKSMFRAVIEPQPTGDDRSVHLYKHEDKLAVHGFGDGKRHYCPFGKIGDRLWVRETFEEWDDGMVYRATEHPMINSVAKWSPPTHMRREQSRVTLEITDIKVERLQDISDDDCDAEFFGGDFPEKVIPSHWYSSDDWGAMSLKECFQVVWQSIKGKDSWNENPFVFVITFKVIK